MWLDNRLQLGHTPFLPQEEPMKVLDATKRKVRELAKIDQIFTDIETSYSDAKKEIVEIVKTLIDIAKSRLSNSRWNEKNLIIACNIVYKLLNRDLFENELGSLTNRLGDGCGPLAYYMQWKINTDIKSKVEDILDSEITKVILQLLGACKSDKTDYNELDLFIAFASRTLNETESDLAFIESSRERLKTVTRSYNSKGKSELLLPAILIWDKKEVSLVDILISWINEFEELIWNRDSIKDWKNSINAILVLFENFEELKRYISSFSLLNENLTPEQLFEKILWLKLFENDWLCFD